MLFARTVDRRPVGKDESPGGWRPDSAADLISASERDTANQRETGERLGVAFRLSHRGLRAQVGRMSIREAGREPERGLEGAAPRRFDGGDDRRARDAGAR